jgi:hypothetical protein
MPRGGGGRGGGFRGGGFRGGGFRGGGGSFRTGVGRTSGRPFGRTGARRTTSRSTRGPYSHAYRRPHRRYWGWYYHRPWWRRWWYSPWWAGYYYRPWYYSPIYIGGGIIFIIIMGLIALPLLGVAIAFPFSDTDASGVVNYRSVETLYFNEYWYEYEYVRQGNTITFSTQSSPSLISFAIWDSPFESLPTTTKFGSFTDQLSIQNNYYEYYSLFLRPDSIIEYLFNASNSIEFFIADGYNLNEWNLEGNPSFYEYTANTHGDSGSLSISEAKDYYLVWYNDEVSTVDVDFTVNYTATNAVDLTAADYFIEEVELIPQTTFTVPNDGNWYFFIYFDPMNSPEESTTITFDVSYTTGVTARDRWIGIIPILVIIGIVVLILIIIAVYARKRQKKLKTIEDAKTSDKTTPTEKTTPVTSKCVRCGGNIKPGSAFCPNCGGKIEGRKIGTSTITTPAKAQSCSFCGNKLTKEAKFCPYCGTKIEQ